MPGPHNIKNNINDSECIFVTWSVLTTTKLIYNDCNFTEQSLESFSKSEKKTMVAANHIQKKHNFFHIHE